MESIDSTTLSPSKARQAASQARDWAFVTSWLKSKYAPKPVPQFERNEDTLKALLNLAAANDAADEEEAVLHSARLEAIQSLKAQQGNGSEARNELVDGFEASLDHKGSTLLEDLAESSVVMGALNPTATELGHSIADFTREEFNAAEQVRSLGVLQKYLDQELESLNTRLDELHDETLYETPADLPAKTDEWLKGTKLLNSRINEYQDRLATPGRGRTGEVKCPSIQELVAEEEDVVSLREGVKTLEGKAKTFHGLPPNLHQAKQEYERLDREHRALVRKRDQMFEELDGSEHS